MREGDTTAKQASGRFVQPMSEGEEAELFRVPEAVEVLTGREAKQFVLELDGVEAESCRAIAETFFEEEGRIPNAQFEAWRRR